VQALSKASHSSAQSQIGPQPLAGLDRKVRGGT
jgi:hypothetical protein